MIPVTLSEPAAVLTSVNNSFYGANGIYKAFLRKPKHGASETPHGIWKHIKSMIDYTCKHFSPSSLFRDETSLDKSIANWLERKKIHIPSRKTPASQLDVFLSKYSKDQELPRYFCLAKMILFWGAVVSQIGQMLARWVTCISRHHCISLWSNDF